MKFCGKCGTQIEDSAVICPACGVRCVAENTVANTAANTVVNTAVSTVTANNGYNVNGTDTVLRKKKKIKPLLVILVSVVLVLAILAAVLFVPRNLKMDDFKKTNNMASAILKYGCPEDIRSDDDLGNYLYYEDKVNFYGITPTSFYVYYETNDVAFFFSDADADDVIKKLEHYCVYEKTLDYAIEYSYEDLQILTTYDGTFVAIKITK